jgi:hypothetical protein
MKKLGLMRGCKKVERLLDEEDHNRVWTHGHTLFKVKALPEIKPVQLST